jgi:DNA-binding beta-propeller fold protein YncE
MKHLLVGILLVAWLGTSPATAADQPSGAERKLLYVAAPGIRDELQYGGHGILVFDINNGHKFVKRIASGGVDKTNHVMNVKGICASAKTGRLYVSTIETLMCFDLASDKMLWEKAYDGGCDRMALTPDGQTIYLPSFEKGHWHVVDALSGDVLKRIALTNAGAHNTIVGPDGRFAYLAGLKSTLLRVIDTKSQEVVREIGPFGNYVRPFTINGAQTLCYANVNMLLGFEIGDLKTGKILQRVEVQGYKRGPTKRHGCPSHGIALTPDEKEIWIGDSANSCLHIFDNTVMPPKQGLTIPLRDQPGWITFGIDGRYVYPSTGDIIETKSHKVIGSLTDETGAAVQSEKLLEIDFVGGKPIRAGDQFALGEVNRGSKRD